MKKSKSKLLYETTSTMRSLLLAVFQVIVPYIFVIITYIFVKSDYSRLAWIPILVGIFFVFIWAIVLLYISILKEWCYMDQLLFIIPLVFTIGFILFATYYSLIWWEFLMGSIVLVVIGYFLAKFFVHFITSKTQLELKNEYKNYLDAHEIHQKEKEYLKDFLDVYTNEEKDN